jgi:hypothetical protein
VKSTASKFLFFLKSLFDVSFIKAKGSGLPLTVAKVNGRSDPVRPFMNVCVAGRFRKNVLPVFQELITMIKTEIVKEEEM